MIVDVISPAKTGVVKNNEKSSVNLFIFLLNWILLFIENDTSVCISFISMIGYKYPRIIWKLMTEQQEHLANLLQQRQTLAQELESLQGQATAKRELFLKVQGVIEYLTQIGVVLPEPETVEEVSEDA